MARRAIVDFAAGLAGACWLLWSGRGLAEEGSPSRSPQVHLSWARDAEAAGACPNAAQIQADVAGRLGFSPFVAGDADSTSIEAFVTHERALWHATVAMRGADGELLGNRHVESAAADCRSLAAAAALAIALMIAPELLLRPPPAVPQSKPVRTPRPASRVALSPATPQPHRGPRGAVAIGAVAAAAVLPKPAFGPLLQGELQLHDHWSVVASAQLLPEQRLTRAGADAWLGLTLGSLGPCYRVKLVGRWTAASCATFLFGSLSLSMASPEAVHAGPRAWWGVAYGLRFSIRVGVLELAFGADAFTHLMRRDYTVSRLQPSRTESLFLEPAGGLLTSLTTGVRF
jgi:hypothetical protein